MEPVTYFFGQANIIIAWTYFLKNGADQTWGDMWQRTVEKNTAKYLQRQGLDYQQLQSLKDKVKMIEQTRA
jgi:hypothetical protein